VPGIRRIGLLAGGLAALAWWAATILLENLGGLGHLADAVEPGLDPVTARNTILWDPERSSVVARRPCAGFEPALRHPSPARRRAGGAWSDASADTHSRVVRLLAPVAAAGSMILTIYSARFLFLAADVLGDYPVAQFMLLVVLALVFAVVWRRSLGRRIGRGPLETLVTVPANRVRRAVAAFAPSGGWTSTRPGDQTSAMGGLFSSDRRCSYPTGPASGIEPTALGPRRIRTEATFADRDVPPHLNESG
jgi:hypothetical protein